MTQTPLHKRYMPMSARITAAAVSAALLFGGAVPVASAHATENDQVSISEEYQKEVERTSKEYDEAKTKLEETNALIKENREKLGTLEAEIPVQAEKSNKAAREQYKLQQQGAGLVDLIFSAEDFGSLLNNAEYIMRISNANVEEMQRLADMQKDLKNTQGTLKEAKEEAKENEEKAKQAFDDAKKAREEAQKRAQEEARRQAEAAAEAARKAEEAKKKAEKEAAEKKEREEAAREAEEAQKKNETVIDTADPDTDAEKELKESKEAVEEEIKAEEKKLKEEAEKETEKEAEEESEKEKSSDSKSKEEEVDKNELIEISTDSVADDANWDAGEEAFVSEWASRIDAYLSGSALEGQGKTFAKAAWKYGVDPRWSPAISNTESSKGAHCFKSHNAWGWGSSSWSSWEEAIDAHVGGLSRGYGYTISVDAAKAYCPPNWANWYNNTLAQMRSI